MLITISIFNHSDDHFTLNTREINKITSEISTISRIRNTQGKKTAQIGRIRNQLKNEHICHVAAT